MVCGRGVSTELPVHTGDRRIAATSAYLSGGNRGHFTSGRRSLARRPSSGPDALNFYRKYRWTPAPRAERRRETSTTSQRFYDALIRSRVPALLTKRACARRPHPIPCSSSQRRLHGKRRDRLREFVAGRTLSPRSSYCCRMRPAPGRQFQAADLFDQASPVTSPNHIRILFLGRRSARFFPGSGRLLRRRLSSGVRLRAEVVTPSPSSLMVGGGRERPSIGVSAARLSHASGRGGLSRARRGRGHWKYTAPEIRMLLANLAAAFASGHEVEDARNGGGAPADTDGRRSVRSSIMEAGLTRRFEPSHGREVDLRIKTLPGAAAHALRGRSDRATARRDELIVPKAAT